MKIFDTEHYSIYVYYIQSVHSITPLYNIIFKLEKMQFQIGFTSDFWKITADAGININAAGMLDEKLKIFRTIEFSANFPIKIRLRRCLGSYSIFRETGEKT